MKPIRVVHKMPPDGEPNLPCCGRPFAQLADGDAITFEDFSVTCLGDLSKVDSKGYYHKYNVERIDEGNSEHLAHSTCDFFVLDLTHDVHALNALLYYANAVRQADPKLAGDLYALAAKFCSCLPDTLSPECPIHGNWTVL